jgi:hypothetical protein
VLEITDIRAGSEMAHAVGAKVIVDNVFATPIFQQPLELGADVVVYSATKHIDGQGRVLGGAILTSEAINEEFYRDSAAPHRPVAVAVQRLGPAQGPGDPGPARAPPDRHRLRALADTIGEHKKVKQVLYPFRADHPGHNVAKAQMSGGGTVLALDLGSREAAFKFLNALEIVDISNNLGDAKSMATHPPTTTHRSVPEEQRPSLGVSKAACACPWAWKAWPTSARCDPCARSGVKPPPAATDAAPARPGRRGLRGPHARHRRARLPGLCGRGVLARPRPVSVVLHGRDREPRRRDSDPDLAALVDHRRLQPRRPTSKAPAWSASSPN